MRGCFSLLRASCWNRAEKKWLPFVCILIHLLMGLVSRWYACFLAGSSPGRTR